MLYVSYSHCLIVALYPHDLIVENNCIHSNQNTNGNFIYLLTKLSEFFGHKYFNLESQHTVELSLIVGYLPHDSHALKCWDKPTVSLARSAGHMPSSLNCDIGRERKVTSSGELSQTLAQPIKLPTQLTWLRYQTWTHKRFHPMFW